MSSESSDVSSGVMEEVMWVALLVVLFALLVLGIYRTHKRRSRSRLIIRAFESRYEELASSLVEFAEAAQRYTRVEPSHHSHEFDDFAPRNCYSYADHEDGELILQLFSRHGGLNASASSWTCVDRLVHGDPGLDLSLKTDIELILMGPGGGARHRLLRLLHSAG